RASPVIPGNAVAVRITVIIPHLPQKASARSKQPLRPQLLQQRLRFFQVARVESFSEPPVNRRQQFARFHRLALVTPEAGEADGGRGVPKIWLAAGVATAFRQRAPRLRVV